MFTFRAMDYLFPYLIAVIQCKRKPVTYGEAALYLRNFCNLPTAHHRNIGRVAGWLMEEFAFQGIIVPPPPPIGVLIVSAQTGAPGEDFGNYLNQHGITQGNYAAMSAQQRRAAMVPVEMSVRAFNWLPVLSWYQKNIIWKRARISPPVAWPVPNCSQI